MQSFNFGIRQSAAETVDDNRSRYVPSSVYSGAGPVDDSSAADHGHAFMSGAWRAPDNEPPQLQQRRVAPSTPNLPRNSTLLNINDPVAMHLLTETAITDSREYEILSFEEVEQLKKERHYLKGRLETTRRKFALESKLRDAAQSLNRLYSTRDAPSSSPRSSRRSFLGKKQAGAETALSRADDEYAASTHRVEQLSREMAQLQSKLVEIERRILEHTAGILQMTHKGLKKNVRRTELPRSPESMTSQLNARRSLGDVADEFDERSLYQIPDYVTDFGLTPRPTSTSRAGQRDSVQAIDHLAARLQELNVRLHTMITQAGSQEHFDPPPQPSNNDMTGRVGAQIQAHLGYLSQGLDALEVAQERANTVVPRSISDSEEQLEDVNIRLHDLLERTNSAGQSPVLPQEEPRGKDLQSQLAFSSSVLERLDHRVETLVEQKDILARQIQQQRELNSKSDAQRDAKIHELSAELEQTKSLHAVGEQEAQHSRNQINLLMEQLDLAKQQGVLLEHERGATESKAVEMERDARKEMEAKLTAETEDLRNRLEVLTAAKIEADTELSKARAEMKELESEVVRVQTELTMVKAELDGAYGTRAQRAADVSMNPAVQKEIDELTKRNTDLESELDLLRREHETKGVGSAELQNKHNALQKELKETIEEYEVMTKQCIEDEKERERLEEQVDSLQQRCENLESQLSEEKVKLLGSKSASSTETTSTMVLKNEFKKMMRESRAESLKALKAEQEERRRLEGLLKGMKRDQQQRQSQKLLPQTPNGAAEHR